MSDELPNNWGFLGGGNDDDQEPEKGPEKSQKPASEPQPQPQPEIKETVPAVPPEDPPPKAVKKSKKKKGKLGKIVKALVILFSVGTLLCIAAFIIGAIYFHGKALTFDFSQLEKVPERTIVYDRHGKEMGHVSGHGANRRNVPIANVSQHFVDALLAREDIRFYEHGGVDYAGVMRAVLTNVKAGGFEQGASTITMQLARKTFDMRDLSLKRKFQEVALARHIEIRKSKDEIMEYYVNRVYFGSGLYGIERASQGYFMKPAAELSLSESAILAGVIRGPSLLNPFRSLESAMDVRDEVLARMVAEELITQAESDSAKAEPIKLRPPSQRFATGNYVLQFVHDQLKVSIDERFIERGGLRVYTTIDPVLQKAAESSLDAHLTSIEKRSGFPHPRKSAHRDSDKKQTGYLQGAVFSVDNKTGGVLAMVGGRDYDDSSYNRATQAYRQVGSTFKPFIYAVAYDRGGLLPGTMISDGPIEYRLDNGKVWRPNNSDGKFGGMLPAEQGLIRSRNTMTIRIGDMARFNNVSGLVKALFGQIDIDLKGLDEQYPRLKTNDEKLP
ncbi:MAG: transglycosylase domain-containing protein, partial [Verrucomicrobiota bacterium]